MKLRVLDLFSGIGGFSLGLERTGGFETKAFCEIDPFCIKVLKKHWPDVPVYRDIFELEGTESGDIDVVVGGDPCQPHSHAGKQRGKRDNRYLWPEMLRIIAKTRPSWIINENVAGSIANMVLDTKCADLEREGYATRPYFIPAIGIGAPHRRRRVWLIAKSHDSIPHSQRPHREEMHEQRPVVRGTESKDKQVSVLRSMVPHKNWETDWSSICRMVNGISGRVDKDRLRVLGNSILPQLSEVFGRAILYES